MKKRNQNIKKFSAVIALSLTIAGTGASVCLPILNAHADNQSLVKGTKTAAQATTEQQVLDAAKAAKAAGVKVTEKARATKTVASKDYEATKKAVSDGYAQQIKTLNDQATKQKAQDAKYQKDLADWNNKYNNGSDASDVVDPNTLIQKLVLNAEPDAKMNVKNLNPDKATGRMLDKKVVDPGFQTVYGTGNNSTGHDDQVLGAYAMASKDTKGVDGNIGEVTYTNLKHSEYDGQKIVKMVVTFSNLKAGVIHNEVNGGHPSVLAAADPTVTLSYFNSNGITYTPKYYTEDGKQVDFSQRHAYLSFGSLNSTGVTIEKAQVVDGGKAVGFSGSSVTAHKDGWLYSDKSNEYADIPDEFKGWDGEKSTKAAYGAGLVDIKTNKLSVNYAVNSKVYVWARASTTIPQSIVPPKPVKPAPLKADYQFTDIKVTPDQPVKTADKEGNSVLKGDIITQHISQATGVDNDNTKYWVGDAIFFDKNGKLPVKYDLKDWTVTDSKGKDVTKQFKLTESDGTVTNKKAKMIKAAPVDGKTLVDDTYTLNAKETAIGDFDVDKIIDVGISMAGNTGEHSYPQIDPKVDKHWTNETGQSTDNKQYLVGDTAEATVSADYPDQSKLVNKVTKIGLVDDYSQFAKYVDYKSSKVFEGTKDVTSEYTITNKDGKVTAMRKDPTKAAAGKAKLVTTFKIKASLPDGTIFKNKGDYILNDVVTPSPEPEIHPITPKADKHWTDGDTNTDGKKYMAGDLADATVSADYPDQAKLADKVTKLGLVDDYSQFAKYVDYKSSKVFEGTKDVTSEYTLTNKDGKVTAMRKDPTKATAGKAKLVTTFKIKDNVPDGTKFVNSGDYIINGVTTPTDKPEIDTYDPKAVKDVESGTVKGETDATIDKKEVKKGDKLTYILGSNDLPVNRKDDIKLRVSKDTLPKEVEYNGFAAYLPDGKGGFTDVTKDVTLKADATKHNLEFTEGKALLDGYNKDKTKAAKTVVIDIYVTASQDGSAFTNTYTLVTNDHTDTSNKVENRTSDAKQPVTPSKPETPKQDLPQTGRQKMYNGLIGAVVALFGGGVGYSVFRKKKASEKDLTK